MRIGWGINLGKDCGWSERGGGMEVFERWYCSERISEQSERGREVRIREDWDLGREGVSEEHSGEEVGEEEERREEREIVEEEYCELRVGFCVLYILNKCWTLWSKESLSKLSFL